jgi:hypothetical protein
VKRRRLIAIILVLVAIPAVAGELWIRKTFGTWLPWVTPERINVCGRTYDRYNAGGEALGADAYIATFDATLFDLPIPLPDLQPTRTSLPYAGCPARIDIVRGDGVIASYGPFQGGP